MSTDAADFDTIVKDIQTLKKDLASLMEHVKTGATDTVSDEAHRLYKLLTTEGERRAATLAQSVEDRPVTSLLIAFAVGFLSSRILIR